MTICSANALIYSLSPRSSHMHFRHIQTTRASPDAHSALDTLKSILPRNCHIVYTP